MLWSFPWYKLLHFLAPFSFCLSEHLGQNLRNIQVLLSIKSAVIKKWAPVVSYTLSSRRFFTLITSYCLQQISKHPNIYILSLICRSRALILIPRKIGSCSQKLGIVKTCQTTLHDWLMSVARGIINDRSKISSFLLKDSGTPGFTQGHSNLDLLAALQIRLWIYKLYYTT